MKAQAEAAIAAVQQQIDINKLEAASPSVFVAGWRPFIGRACSSAFAMHYLLLPLANWLLGAFGHPPLWRSFSTCKPCSPCSAECWAWVPSELSKRSKKWPAELAYWVCSIPTRGRNETLLEGQIQPFWVGAEGSATGVAGESREAQNWSISVRQIKCNLLIAVAR
jgi:hypothetical protein